jgi:aspartyl aminopeptidase
MESSQPYTQQMSPRALRTISHNMQKSKQKSLAKDVPVKTPQQVAKDMAASTKPNFTSIHAEKLSLKADYRNSLIVTRDK